MFRFVYLILYGDHKGLNIINTADFYLLLLLLFINLFIYLLFIYLRVACFDKHWAQRAALYHLIIIQISCVDGI